MQIDKKELLRLLMEDGDSVDITKVLPKGFRIIEENTVVSNNSVSGYDDYNYNVNNPFYCLKDNECPEIGDINSDSEIIVDSSTDDGYNPYVDSNPARPDSTNSGGIGISTEMDNRFMSNSNVFDSKVEDKTHPLDNSTGPSYQKVLMGQITYLDFIKSKPELFTIKRIGWKVNKFLGINPGDFSNYKDFYEDNFLDLCTGKEGQALIKLGLEYGLINTRINDTIDVIKILLNYGLSPSQVLFAMIRGFIPSRTVKYSDGREARKEKFSFSKINYNISYFEGLFKKLKFDELLKSCYENDIDPLMKELYLVYMEIVTKNSEEQMLLLLNDNYKEIIENKKRFNFFRKVANQLNYLETKRHLNSTDIIYSNIKSRMTKSIIELNRGLDLDFTLEDFVKDSNLVMMKMRSKFFDVRYNRKDN